jgi:acyl-CoA synthetase (AMP-forming)/AMP-acid ligase II
VLSTNLTAQELRAESYESVVAGTSDEPLDIDVPESDAAFIMYTSGTTGRPKGAVLTHLNLVMARVTLAVATGGMPDTPESTLLGVPMFHIAGLSLILGALATGGRVVMQHTAASFDAAAAVDLLEQERIAVCFFVPSQWAEICAVPGIRERRFALRYVMWGAAVAPPSVLRALADTFPEVPAYCAFGQTEMSPTTCLLRAEDAIIKMGSVGKPLPWIEVRIVDDEMADVAPGAVGEIVYRGPTVMREYWRNEKATAEAFQGGWFHSGDLCRVDEDGFVWVMDRKKDMIISGGENIYCAEVEYAIDAHPKVAQVAVVGVTHEKWGETPVAVIVPADPGEPPTEQEIIEHCRARLASYKKPTSVVFADDLPRTASGKVQKFKLRESLP